MSDWAVRAAVANEMPTRPTSLLPTGGAVVRVVVLAAVRIYRDALASGLAGRADVRLVGAADGDEALELVYRQKPDVALVDVSAAAGLKMVRALREAAPELKIVVFALGDVDEDVLACAEAGVMVFVSPDAPTDRLIHAVESAQRGELLCSPRVAKVLLGRLGSVAGSQPRRANAALTDRERQIGGLIEEGLTNKEIAVRLRIEVATVKNHVHNVLEKLGVARRGQAAAWLRAAAADPPGPGTPPSAQMVRTIR